MKVAVLGGNGFLGIWIVERLLRAGCQVRVLSRSGEPSRRTVMPPEQLEWQQGDALDRSSLEQCLAGVDAVIHLADSGLPGDPGYRADSAQLMLADRLIDGMAACKTSKLLFLSSGGAVYGPSRDLPIDESHPRRPISAYGLTKRAVEDVLLERAPAAGIELRILRVANAYGPGQRLDGRQGVVAAFLVRSLTNRPLALYGQGRNVRDFIHASDVADACLRALEYGGPHAVFNIGSGIGTSLSQLADLIESRCGNHGRTCLPQRKQDVPINVLSSALARRELGWRPRIGLDEGLDSTKDWVSARLAPSRL